MKCSTVKEWLQAMKEHACENKNLTPDDDYIHLTVNCTCTCGEKFSIGLVSVKETENDIEPQKRDIFKELIKSRAGREELVKQLDKF
jgi:hypothetical protein